MQERDLSHHGLAIKRHATAEAVASLIDLDAAAVKRHLEQAKATGRAIETPAGYTLTPLARVALDASYLHAYGRLRTDATFHAAYEQFEVVNRSLKQAITDWQTVSVRGERIANDHSDQDYDRKIIDRLGQLHEQIEPLLARLAAREPRLAVYARKLGEALERAEDGDIDWVSEVRRESYHTVWFELHEDLLRIMGRIRDE